MPPKLQGLLPARALGLCVDAAVSNLGLPGGGWAATPTIPTAVRVRATADGHGAAPSGGVCHPVNASVRSEAGKIVRRLLETLVHLGLMLLRVDHWPVGALASKLHPGAGATSFDGICSVFASAPGAQRAPGGGRYAGFHGERAAVEFKVRRAPMKRQRARAQQWRTWFAAAKATATEVPAAHCLAGIKLVIFLIDGGLTRPLTEVAVTVSALNDWAGGLAPPALHYAAGPLAPRAAGAPPTTKDARWDVLAAKRFLVELDDGTDAEVVTLADVATTFYKSTSANFTLKRKLEAAELNVWVFEHGEERIGNPAAKCARWEDVQTVLGDKFPCA